VNLGVGGLPSDAVWSFSPPSISGSGSSALSVASSIPGVYHLTISGTSGAMVRSGTVVLAVQNPDFSLSISPASVLVASKGGTASFTVAIGRVGGLTDTINLSLAGAPANFSATFNPNPADGSSTLAVTVAPGTAAGSYLLTITAVASSNPSLSHTATATLLVAANPTAVYVTLPSGTNGYSMSGGKNNTANLTVRVALRNDFGDPVAGASVASTLYLNGAAYGSASATTGSDGTTTFVARNAPAGTYSTKVTSVSASGLSWDGTTPGNSYIKAQ